MPSLPAGKLPVDLLRRLLASRGAADPRVIVGPGVGFDAAVIEMGDRCLAAKTDPVTFAADEIGWYAVHVNANDVACCGAAPRWFLATVLLPEQSATVEMAESIFEQLSRACRELGVSLCGGHTEITHGLDRPIVVGQMLGETSRDKLVTAGGARPGDAILLTKAIALEGTALIARERAALLADVLSPDELEHCRRLLHSPGISIVREARLALEVGGVHALHDPTEGGLATGLRELAEASQTGLIVDRASIPVLPECERICRKLGLDPLGLIASGSLLLSVDDQRAAAIERRLTGDGIAVARIGQITPAEQGCRLRLADGRLAPLPRFDRDELAHLFSPAAEQP